MTRRALNRITRSRITQSMDLLDDVSDFLPRARPQTERNLTVYAVTDAVIALPPPQRVAIVLHHFEGLPLAEIFADITGGTVPAVP